MDSPAKKAKTTSDDAEAPKTSREAVVSADGRVLIEKDGKVAQWLTDEVMGDIRQKGIFGAMDSVTQDMAKDVPEHNREAAVKAMRASLKQVLENSTGMKMPYSMEELIEMGKPKSSSRPF